MYLCIVKLLEVKHDKSLNITDVENQAHVENVDAMAYIYIYIYIYICHHSYVCRIIPYNTDFCAVTLNLCCYYVILV